MTRSDTFAGRRRVAALVILAGSLALMAQDVPVLSKGQTLYVPVYSHIYWGPKARPFNLACTLSIRNIDPREAITLVAVEYYDTHGKKVKSYLDKPLKLAPLGTREYYIEEKDTKGGSGANFIVKWVSERPANAPLVECIMIGVEGAQGVSFTSRGRAILEPPPK
jgi:hypothetical protein